MRFNMKLFETPLDQLEQPYEIWMKAEPRRHNHTIGSKWLRQGGNSSTQMADIGGGKNVGMTGGVDVHNLEN